MILRRWSSTLALGLGILCGAAWGASGVQPGEKAPEAAGIVLNGPEDVRVSTLAGRVRVVEFWASWCGPCIESMPRIDGLRRDVHAAGYGERFEVLGVGLDHDVEAAKRFLGVHPVSFPIVVDTLGIASRSYGVWRLPATFLLAEDGTVKQIYHGYGPGFSDDLRRRVFDLLAPASSASPAAVQAQ